MTTITQTITALPPAPTRADPTNFSARGDALMTALPGMVTEINTLKDQINTVAGEVNTNATTASTGATTATTQAGIATTKAAEAAASAASAVNAPGTSSTSTTSVALTAGSKTFTTQTGKTYPVGASVKFARTSDVTKWAVGTVVSYDSGTGDLVLSVDANDINGTGTFADWTLSISGHRGAPGAAAAAPALVLISTATASGVATVDFTSGIDSTYDEYEIHFQNVTPSVANQLYLRLSKDNGAAFLAGTEYVYATLILDSSGASTVNNGASVAQIKLSSTSVPVASSFSSGISGKITLCRPSANRNVHVFYNSVFINDSSVVNAFVGSGSVNMGNTFVCNAVRFMFASGNVASGEFKLYGVKKS